MDTEQVAISDARANLTEIVANVRLLGKTVILTQRGTPKAAIVPLELLELIQGAASDAVKPKRATRKPLEQPASDPRSLIRNLPSMG